VRFEWDETKRWANVAKHGIDFIDAIRAFDGRMLTKLDQRRDYGEIRFRGIGMMDGRIVLAVWTERDGAIRLISVWRANAKERAQYQAEQKEQDSAR
jgi:uncharacterized DUF497 family protein